jgi:O-antigen ligase
MSLAARIAWLSLLAALSAPALILLPRTAHPFAVGPALAVPLLALLAAGLAWRGVGAPLARPWAAGLAVTALAWGLLLLLLRPWGQRLIGQDLTPQLPWLERGTLALFGLLLAWEAGRDNGARIPAWVRRLGLGLAALWCLSGAQSLRPDEALEALLIWGAYPLVFAAAWMLAEGPRQRRRLLLLLLSVGALNAAYAFLQAIGQDPVAWNRGFAGRAMGFFGNPNFLGGHLALLLPLGLALALDERGTPRAQAWRWLLTGLLFLGLLLTQTRGAWGGAAVGCAVVLVLAARRMPGLLARQRRPLLGAAVLVVLLGGFYLVAQPQARERILSVLSGQDVEAGRRAFLMKKTAQIALEHPALGVGPGNFRVWFPSVQVRGLAAADYDKQPYILSQHSHNDILQMAADSGWLAALLWIALLLSVLGALKGGLEQRPALARAQPESLLVLGALGGLLALQVHGLANFPFLIVNTQAAAWAIAAVGLRALGPVSSPPAPPAGRWALAWVLVAILALGGLGARRLLKDQLWWMGEGELNLGNLDLAGPTLFRALNYDRREDRLWLLYGRADTDREMVWNSVGSLREAVRLNPFDAESAVRLGRNLVTLREHAEAEAVLKRVAGYAPNFIDLWEPLAAALYQQEKYEDAIGAYDWMLFFRVNEEAAYANKAAAQASLGQLPQALMTLHGAQQKLPQSGKIQLNLAITYLKLGLKEQARESWRKAEQLSPSDPQVDQLRGVLR